MFIGFKSKTETKFYHNIHCLYIPPFIMETPKSEGLTSSVVRVNINISLIK
jgi:hypothetical protein